MNVECFRTYCLSKPYVSEHFPFDEVTLVFKIAQQKAFVFLPLDEGDKANLKCDPEKALDYREHYTGVQPGFHMNKKHWNTIFFNEDLSGEFIYQLIDHSYDLVYKGLTKKVKQSHPL